MLYSSFSQKKILIKLHIVSFAANKYLSKCNYFFAYFKNTITDTKIVIFMKSM